MKRAATVLVPHGDVVPGGPRRSLGRWRGRGRRHRRRRAGGIATEADVEDARQVGLPGCRRRRRATDTKAPAPSPPGLDEDVPSLGVWRMAFSRMLRSARMTLGRREPSRSGGPASTSPSSRTPLAAATGATPRDGVGDEIVEGDAARARAGARRPGPDSARTGRRRARSSRSASCRRMRVVAGDGRPARRRRRPRAPRPWRGSRRAACAGRGRPTPRARAGTARAPARVVAPRRGAPSQLELAAAAATAPGERTDPASRLAIAPSPRPRATSTSSSLAAPTRRPRKSAHTTPMVPATPRMTVKAPRSCSERNIARAATQAPHPDRGHGDVTATAALWTPRLRPRREPAARGRR